MKYLDYRKKYERFILFIKDTEGFDQLIYSLDVEGAKELQSELSSIYNAVTHWIEKQEERDER